MEEELVRVGEGDVDDCGGWGESVQSVAELRA